MPKQLLTFQRFSDRQLANTIAAQLNLYHIPSEIEDSSNYFDPSYAFNKIAQDIALKLAPADFERAHAALESCYSEQLDTVEKDYYLFEFTDQELMEIIREPYSWGTFDYLLAKKILAAYGTVISAAQATLLKQRQVQAMAVPERAADGAVVSGYLLAYMSPFLLLSNYGNLCFLPSFIGCVCGSVIAYHQKTLPDGNSVYLYTGASRKQGRHILVTGIIFIVIELAYLLWLAAGK